MRWLREEEPGHYPKGVYEYLGLYRQRLYPTWARHANDWWRISDEASARSAAQDMVAQLELHGWPVLEALLTRDGFVDYLRRGDLGLFQLEDDWDELFARAHALLLMDAGPSSELDEWLSAAADDVVEEEPGAATAFGSWVRDQSLIAGDRSVKGDRQSRPFDRT